MTSNQLVRVPFEKAAQVCEIVELDDPALRLLRPGDAPRVFLDRLTKGGLFADAIRFLAHALPKREAVWWHCVSLRQAPPAEPLEEADRQALEAAEAWVFKPGEATCEAAGKLAEASGFGTPAGLAAAGAYWAGESLAPAGSPKVPPGPQLTATAVANGLILAGVEAGAEGTEAAYRRILANGVQIAQGVTSKKAFTQGGADGAGRER